LVRAGKHGEAEQLALDESVVGIGWPNLGDLTGVSSRDEVLDRLRDSYSQDGEKRLLNFASQVWAFVERIEVGDLVVLPLKSTPAIAIGRVTSNYRHAPLNPPNASHVRDVEWLRTDLPRSSVGQDLLYSLGAFMTVCEVKRNSAADRLSALAVNGKDPGAASFIKPKPTGSASAGPPASATDDDDEGLSEDTAPVDIEQLATDRIRAFIAERFTGHDLARLVEAVLRARGLFTYRSPAGADGGIDVLAGGGALGMDAPKICVQVKAGDSPVDVKIVRELHGVLTSVQADQGLLVAWAGLTKPAEAEVRSQFFRIRAWTADDVIRAVIETYDRLPDEIQAELPLKRIWTVVLDEEGDG
jgi:restriction system protein